MESIRNQVLAVNNKVDALYQMVEDISKQLSEVLSQTRQTSGAIGDTSSWKLNDIRYSYRGSTKVDAALAHKDVLADTGYVDTGSHNREKELAPEIQIQRLTAQLTAAYNRIAALEEQLLAQRVH